MTSRRFPPPGYRRTKQKLLHHPRQQRSGVGLRVFRDRAWKADGGDLLIAAHRGQYRQAAGAAHSTAVLVAVERALTASLSAKLPALLKRPQD